MRAASRLAWRSSACLARAECAGTTGRRAGCAAFSSSGQPLNGPDPAASAASTSTPTPTPPLIKGLRLVALASVAGAAAVVLPNLSAQGAPHAVKLMGAETPTYRRTGAARAARLAQSAPGGAASLASAGAAAVLAPIIRGEDGEAAADACAVGTALVGVAGVGGDGGLGAALAAAAELVARGRDGPAVGAARDFLWAAKKQQQGER